eukprot:scaffold3169_cov117-Skeletonema_dohrnii-CCMP3373.AAC.7
MRACCLRITSRFSKVHLWHDEKVRACVFDFIISTRVVLAPGSSLPSCGEDKAIFEREYCHICAGRYLAPRKWWEMAWRWGVSVSRRSGDMIEYLVATKRVQ